MHELQYKSGKGRGNGHTLSSTSFPKVITKSPLIEEASQLMLWNSKCTPLHLLYKLIKSEYQYVPYNWIIIANYRTCIYIFMDNMAASTHRWSLRRRSGC